jgi:hypothetical protein
MPTTSDPLTTLTELLHHDGWEVQLAGTATTPTSTRRVPHGVAYVVPATTGPNPGDLR